MISKKLVTVALLLGLGWTVPAAADTILFDIDGNTGPQVFKPIDNLDWGAGNSYAEGVNALSPLGTTFQLYYQANLDTAKLSSGQIQFFNDLSSQTGTNLLAQDSITLVLGFQETLTGRTFDIPTSTASLTFAFAEGGDNFFQIYANTDPGNNLTGACFVCGTLIMEGSIIGDGFVSSFDADLNPGLSTFAIDDLDNAGVDDYPTVDTITGIGSVQLRAVVDPGYNTNWFQGLNPGDIIDFAFASTSTALPFNEIDPSACFFATTSTGGLTPVCTDSASNQTGVTPFIGVGTVGTINGLNGNNTMFQADAINSFEVSQVVNPIPEPATLTLLGIGLAGAAAARRRKKAQQTK